MSRPYNAWPWRIKTRARCYCSGPNSTLASQARTVLSLSMCHQILRVGHAIYNHRSPTPSRCSTFLSALRQICVALRIRRFGRPASAGRVEEPCSCRAELPAATREVDGQGEWWSGGNVDDHAAHTTGAPDDEGCTRPEVGTPYIIIVTQVR